MGDIWDWIEKYESLLDDYHNIQDQLSILTDIHNDLVNKYHRVVAINEEVKVFYTDFKTELPKSAVVYCVGVTLIAIDLADDNNLIVISHANNWRATITNVVKAILHFFETDDYITYTVYNLKTDDFIRRFFEVENYKQFEGLRGEKTLSGLIRATEKNKAKAKALIDRFEKIL